ncbi:MAG TPA: HAD hydrolase family protein [Gemmatimonadaceae bacterium]|nr:HAD hydrolase family protein [Gemmatimonadaceae bacterium]
MIDSSLARSIRLVGFDVDGVMTDGGIYLGAVAENEKARPFELKRYDIQDGVGMHLLSRAGIRLAIVTGRVSETVRLRATELGIEDVAQDPVALKLPGFLEILRRRDVALEHAAFVGDDFPDLPILRLVGMAVAVGNATEEVRRECAIRLTRRGGHGAIREFAELLLKARGEWDRAWNGYVDERSAKPTPVPT